MIISNAKAIIGGIVILAVGYIAGAKLKVPFAEEELLQGDVQKASLFNKASEEDTKIAAERMLNDTTYQQQMVLSYAVLASRAGAIDSLANATYAATQGIDSLKDLNRHMATLKEKAGNVVKMYDELLTATEKVLNGETPDNYGALAANAANAFLLIDKDADAPRYIALLADYGVASKNDKLLSAAAGWLSYGATDAALTGDTVKLDNYIKFCAEAKQQPELALLARNAEQLGFLISGTPIIVRNNLVQLSLLPFKEKLSLLPFKERLSLLPFKEKLEMRVFNKTSHTLGKLIHYGGTANQATLSKTKLNLDALNNSLSQLQNHDNLKAACVDNSLGLIYIFF